MKVALYLFMQRRASADEVTNAPTQAFMNGVKEYLTKIQWSLVPQPRISAYQILCRFANPITFFVQAILDASVQELPKSRHTNHSRDMSILNGARKCIARQFRQISNLSPTTQWCQEASGEFKGMMQWQDR